MVSKLSSAEVLHFLIIVTVVLVFARILGELCRRIKQPAIIGEMLAGIVLGPTILQHYYPGVFKDLFLAFPRSYGAFDGFAEGNGCDIDAWNAAGTDRDEGEI